MLFCEQPPVKPQPKDFGLTEADIQYVQQKKKELSEKKHNVENFKETTAITLACVIFFPAVYLLAERYFDNFEWYEIVGIIFGLTALRILALPMALLAFIIERGLNFVWPKTQTPKMLAELDCKLKSYEISLMEYEKKRLILHRKYPDIETCDFNFTKYKELLYEELKKNLRQEIIRVRGIHREAWWKKLSWREFEWEVARWFERKGYKAIVNKGNNDGGYDILVEKGKERALVQCKHYKGHIGVEIVRELNGILVPNRANKGYIACLDGGLTKEAVKFAKLVHIDVITLQELIKPLSKDEEGEADAKIAFEIDNYWFKNEFADKSTIITNIKNGKYDEFYGDMKFRKEEQKVQRTLFDEEDCEFEEPYYGIRRVSRKFPFYVVVYSTKERLELLNVERELFDRSTKTLHIRSNTL